MSNAVAWVVVADADLNDYAASKVMDSFRTKILASGQANPFTNTMHDVTSMIRGYIGKRYALSLTAYAIPPDMKWAACLLICQAMQGRLPGVELLKGQEKRIEMAEKFLEDLKAGDVAIALPIDPDTQPALQIPGGIQVVSHAHRRIHMHDLRAL